MANSFNRYNWNPIRHGYYHQPQVQPQSIKPKVINIPVQFIGTDERTTKMSPATPALVPSEEARISAAVTIQRAVRGFVVRKNARVVRQIAAEVDEMERMLKEEEAKIRMDARERLRVNEALMALLLRLDTVRGVREFRKKVIRRVITLQETIDSISAAADGTTPAIGVAEDREYSSSEAADESLIDNEKEADQTLDQDEETMEIPPSVESPNGKSDLIAAGDDGTISMSAIADNRKDLMFEAAEETNEAAAEMEMKIQELDESANTQNNLIGLGIGSGVDSLDTEEIPKGDDLVSSQCSSLMVDSPTEEKGHEGIEMREIMQNMAAENERLKQMVEQLCATSAEQCTLMEGLAGRIERLERFVVNRMDRRRKKRGPVSSAK
ncbi:uncharacterized protein LOC110103873 [Dendrobium catenatum]|uniref:BAG family molecular chaperone regulator 5, mitochondrial n=1 Tax=Dendrobium catenatum TaxID=906689 RepID=A0A2I0XHI1_9ASPA|nr:uncharacterized protein LOC110103873 [Dendrobium catenatum]PKU87371.1 BAG family molecular chaperone regulator 5, mitochondrial [Dendrobium catenatum]